jgi:hypothetical protein
VPHSDSDGARVSPDRELVDAVAAEAELIGHLGSETEATVNAY